MSKYSYLEARISKLEKQVNDLRVSDTSRNWVSYEEYQRVLHQVKRNVQGETNTLKEENNTLKQQLENCTKEISRLGELLLHKTIEISELKAKNKETWEDGLDRLTEENENLKRKLTYMKETITRQTMKIGETEALLRKYKYGSPKWEKDLECARAISILSKIEHIMKEMNNDDDGSR